MQALKYKILSNGTVVICNGSIHTLPAFRGFREVKAACWCHLKSREQLRLWYPTFAAANAARIEAKYGA